MNRLRQLETFARSGWFARGIVYVLLGYLALTTASKSENGPQGVFRQVRDMPAGLFLLALLALGLTLYGAYRLYGAALDSEGQGSNFKGIAIRVGYAASGAAHFALAWLALKLIASGEGSAAHSGEAEAAAANTVLALPMGGTLLGAVGLGFFAASAHQAAKAWRATFLAGLDPRAPHWTKPVGQAGIAARAIVFAIVGYSLVRAAWFQKADEVKGMGDAIAMLRDSGWAYALVALGLLMFGVYSFMEARWRRIRNEDVIARMRSVTR